MYPLSAENGTPRMNRALVVGGAAALVLLAFSGARRAPRAVRGVLDDGRSGVEGPATLTPTSHTEAFRLLGGAFEDASGTRPSADALAMLAAQSAVETAGWKKMHRWNFGNITTKTGPFFRLVNDTAHKYRIYQSAEDGARALVELLRDHYPEAWRLLGADDVRTYAEALKSRGYYEASPAEYAIALRSWYPSFRAVTQGQGNA